MYYNLFGCLFKQPIDIIPLKILQLLSDGLSK